MLWGCQKDSTDHLAAAKTAIAAKDSSSAVLHLKNALAQDPNSGETRLLLGTQELAVAWDAVTAMAALDIVEEPFEHLQGNHMGYARARSIGLNPMNPLKHKTRFHEIAYAVLGHNVVADIHDDEALTRQIEEAEAEGVAYLLCALLDLPGQAESRFYIQGWLQCGTLPERSAKRIFGAADRIMKAGQPVQH